MKATMKTTATLFTAVLLAVSARAAVLYQDNFESYAQGPLPTNNLAINSWVAHSGNPLTGIQVIADPSGGSANALQVSEALTLDINGRLDTNKSYGEITITNVWGTTPNLTTNYNYALAPTNAVNTLFAKYTIYVTKAPTGAAQTYFGHFYINSSTFVGKLWLVTNGVATPGTFRVAIQAGTGTTNTIPVDLSINTQYTLVERYVLSSGSSTVWLNPVSEVSGNNAIATDSVNPGNIQSYAFRQATTGEGILDVDNFVAATRFADVVPGSVNPPTIVTQPQSTNVFASSSAVFKTLASGDDIIGYQWYSVTNNVTNSIVGATGTTLALNNLQTNQTGYIFCVATNGVGTNVTLSAQLTVSPAPIPPIIDTNITPLAATNTIGDTVTFTVVAHGLPAVAYQWKFVPATNSAVTNLVTGPNTSGTNTATLTLSNLTTNQIGSYFVTITNAAGYLITNSAKASLQVVPPPSVSIATLRGMVDPVTFAPTNTTAMFTATGIVTTWTNLSTGGCEFFIQDNSGGISVYWSGAANSNLPPFGAQVQVTAPLAAFNNLLEMEPVYTNALQHVTVLSTGNQPVAHPLPFDPNITGNLATMQKLEGDYFVASNVTLAAGSTFVSASLGEPITANTSQVNVYSTTAMTLQFTNTAGQTFVFYVNSYTDIPGISKPSGPVTIYGVMGNYKNTFEFTPSRYADIISYIHVTNVMANARKGDLATNSYTESVVRPGESLTTYISIADAAGGSVTVSPTGPLPTGAAWSNITGGTTATAVFSYTGNAANAGNSFPIQLNVTSTAGTAYTEAFNVYVPTAQEQLMYITEFLATPTTNPAAGFYNPLARASAVNGISTNDQYVELVNLSDTDLNGQTGTKFTLDTGNASSPVFSSFDGAGAILASSNSLVVFGGDGSPVVTPGLATPVFRSRGLFLPTTGSGVLVFRNSNGNIIDRVAYASGDLSTNGSLSRFPTLNSGLVPQTYISTNLDTPGAQYDGGAWNLATKVPAGVTGVTISYATGQAVLKFPASTTQASTLWNASGVGGPYSVIFGKPFPSGNGSFTNANAAAQQFYYITTQ